MNTNFLSCPVCRSDMSIQAVNSLKCCNNHCFDISKKGYVNFLSKPVKDNYQKELWAARRRVCSQGFFAPLMDEIVRIINQITVEPTILDACCGEGSHLFEICGRVKTSSATGFDISKDGINMAAANKGIFWCVADMTKMPYKDETFDVILNILSPSNYSEFKRCLKPGGVLIKVVPRSDYLVQLRTAYNQNDSYSNESVIDRLDENLSCIDRVIVKYDFAVTNEILNDIITMTPLSWHKKRPENIDTGRITADFVILVAKA